MNAAPEISPVIAPDAGWSAASERVSQYLRAHRMGNPGQIARLTADIIAIARAQSRPDATPLVLAMEALDACMTGWFARLLPADEADDAQLRSRGRVALAMGEVPARWPSYFLSGKAMPVELVRVMREAELGRSPEIKFTNMAPRLMAQASKSGSRLRWQWSYRWPFLRIVTGLTVVLSLLGATLAGGR